MSTITYPVSGYTYETAKAAAVRSPRREYVQPLEGFTAVFVETTDRRGRPLDLMVTRDLEQRPGAVVMVTELYGH